MGDTTMSSAVLKIFRPHSSCASTLVFHKRGQCFQLRITRSFIHFQLSQFQHLSNCKPSWKQRKSFNMPSKPLLPQNPEPFGIVALLQEWALTKQEMARKMWAFKRANPKTPAVFSCWEAVGCWFFFSKLPSSGLSGVQRLSSQTSSAKKTSAASGPSSYPTRKISSRFVF